MHTKINEKADDIFVYIKINKNIICLLIKQKTII